MLVGSTRRSSFPSSPGRFAATQAMVRFCGETILPSTPPELFAAASRSAASPVLFAAVTCRAPNSAFDDVSEPETATPNQPSTGERNASPAPAAATNVPIVDVWPDRFITYANASTPATVRIANRSSFTVARYSLTAPPTGTASATAVRMPANSTSVPPVLRNGSEKVLVETGFPFGAATFSPGQWNFQVAVSSSRLIGGTWPSEKITMIRR